MLILPGGDNICMKCDSLFSGRSNKYIFTIVSAEILIQHAKVLNTSQIIIMVKE